MNKFKQKKATLLAKRTSHDAQYEHDGLGRLLQLNLINVFYYEVLNTNK